MKLFVVSSLFLFLTIVHPVFVDEAKMDLAIVIDDLGNHMKGTEEMINLPVKMTFAVMPFMPSSKKDAEMAYHNGHEVIVHLPMEPKKGKKSWLGPGAITTDLSDAEIRKRVEAAIEDIPHAIGMNHHMGSKATEDERVMRIVLEVCKERGLFYLDSKTTGKSVVGKLANELNVPYLENNLFFDDVYTIEHVRKQALQLNKRLTHYRNSSRGTTEKEQLIAIGHVGISGPIMVDILKEYIPRYESRANLVPLSYLIPEYQLIQS